MREETSAQSGDSMKLDKLSQEVDGDFLSEFLLIKMFSFKSSDMMSPVELVCRKPLFPRSPSLLIYKL